MGKKLPPLEGTTLSVPEAGVHLNMSRNAAYAAAKRGEIPTLKFGKLLRVPTAELRKMLGLSTSREGGAA